MRRALRRARDGVTLDRAEAVVLLAARGDDLADLMTAAGGVRDAGLLRAGRPATVTYSPKVFVPVTRLCRDRCHYCTFVTTPGALRKEGLQPFLTLDEVLAIAREGAELGCAEVLFSAIAPRTAGRRHVVGSTRRVTTRPWPTCAPWRLRCLRRPGFFRISIPGSCPGRNSAG